MPFSAAVVLSNSLNSPWDCGIGSTPATPDIEGWWRNVEIRADCLAEATSFPSTFYTEQTEVIQWYMPLKQIHITLQANCLCLSWCYGHIETGADCSWSCFCIWLPGFTSHNCTLYFLCNNARLQQRHWHWNGQSACLLKELVTFQMPCRTATVYPRLVFAIGINLVELMPIIVIHCMQPLTRLCHVGYNT